VFNNFNYFLKRKEKPLKQQNMQKYKEVRKTLQSFTIELNRRNPTFSVANWI
jgi:hypothetical protein